MHLFKRRDVYMMRTIGTTVRGVRAPIIKEGDNLVNIVVDSLVKAMESIFVLKLSIR
jgi:hypothetical protein